MEPLYPDRRQRGYARALFAVCIVLAMAPALAANADREAYKVEGNNLRLDLNANTRSLDNLTLRQGSTLITAKKSSGREDANDSTWDVKGEVHIEFNGAVLDADAATVKFVDNRLKTIHVQGAPARFSHPLKSGDRVVKGRAAIIDYDAATALVQFSGGTQFEDGRNQITTDKLTYSINDNSVSTSQSRSQAVIQPGSRVPAPKTPDRKTAQ